jgi:hypothetical protein
MLKTIWTTETEDLFSSKCIPKNIKILKLLSSFQKLNLN